MLPPRRRLILPLVFLGIRVRLIFTVDYLMHLIWTLNWTADFSIYRVEFTDFDCRLLRSPDVDTKFDF